MAKKCKTCGQEIEDEVEMIAAWIFKDVGGYYVNDHDRDIFDTRGRAYPTKADALRAAFCAGYTHAEGSGTCWEGLRRIPVKYRKGW